MMGVPCVAVLLDAVIANWASRLKSGRRGTTSAGLTGCTFSTIYTWALSLSGTYRTLEMTIRKYIGSVARRVVRV